MEIAVLAARSTPGMCWGSYLGGVGGQVKNDMYYCCSWDWIGGQVGTLCVWWRVSFFVLGVIKQTRDRRRWRLGGGQGGRRRIQYGPSWKLFSESNQIVFNREEED